MTEHPSVDDAFVVGLDPRIVGLRRRARRAQTVSAYVTAVGGALVVGLGAFVFSLDDSWIIGLAIAACGVLLLSTGIGQFRRLRRDDAWYAGRDLPAEAFRADAGGVRFSVEGAAEPVVLPWAALGDVAVGARLRQPILTFTLADGVDAGTAGVSGLGQPPVVKALARTEPVRRGFFYGLNGLTASADDIDAAFRRLSGGSVTIRR